MLQSPVEKPSNWGLWKFSGVHIAPKMRFNQKELAAVGMEAPKYFTKEGPLYMKVTVGGWRRKGLDYSERWCRLRGNLLFFFKDRNLLPEPQGVIVLEQCFIKEEYGEVKPHAFCIEFVGEEHNQYFAAHSMELRDEWVAALRKASYEILRSQLHKLRIQILARTGRDPVSEGQPGVIDPGDLSDGAQNDPVLEMSISCNNIPTKQNGEEPSVYVSINCMTPPDTKWLNCGQTEIIDRQINPFFVSTVVFETSRNIAVITRLRANIYSVEDRTHQSHCAIGHAICSFKDIIAAPGNKLVLNIIGADDDRPCGGTISLLLWELDTCTSPDTERDFHILKPPDLLSTMIIGPNSPPATLQGPRPGATHSSKRDSIPKGLYGCICNKKYRYINPDKKIVQVEEIMAESKLAFHIPQKMLELYLAEEKRKLQELSMFAMPSDEWDKIGLTVMSEHVNMIEQYTQSLEQLRKLQKKEVRLFKKTTERCDKRLEFVPTNLHLQRLRVEEQGSKAVVYDVITVGAPCAHTMKFKHGGLRRLFHQYAEEQSRLVGNNHCLSSQAAEVLAKVTELGAQVDWCCKDLSLAAKHKDINCMRVKTQALNDQITTFCEEVSQLLEQCAVPALQKTHSSYHEATKAEGRSERRHHRGHHHAMDNGGNARNSGTSAAQVNPRQSVVSASSGMCTSPGGATNGVYEEWEQSRLCLQTSSQNGEGGLSSWDSMCRKIQESVSMLQQVVEMLPDSASAAERMTAVDPGLQSLAEALHKLQEQAKCSVGFQRLQEEYKNLDFLQNLQNRRDLVFSQVITALIAGVMTQLKENLGNNGYLKQLCKLGFLAHFESLLSTYGDEMGMLEDMAASIKDLQGVTFKFLPNQTEEIDSKPNVTGSRNNIVVEVPLDLNMMTKLPDELRRGQPIKVTPVLFTVGINEEQSLAELFGDTSLQEAINKENMHKLDVYFDRYLRLILVEDRPPTHSTLSIELLMTSLRHHVQSKRQKNVEILHTSRQLVRRINGIRFMSCKSAKDRTGMSVTLEQCQLLQDEHSMDAHMFAHLLQTMRSEGTRRDNSRKNTGINRYAFNKMQLKAFPKLYRPPEGTYGKNIST